VFRATRARAECALYLSARSLAHTSLYSPESPVPKIEKFCEDNRNKKEGT